MIKLDDCRIDGSKKIHIDKMPTSAEADKAKKAKYLKKTQECLAQITSLQDKLYADNREGVVILLQAMDAAGKDSTIKHVMSGVNPQGVEVTSFKQPTSEELAHDYLWRAVKALPRRGMMAIFNRSYYEDVLVVRVHQIQKHYQMPERCIDRKDFFENRYKEISGFEEYLHDNGYRVIKIFLNVGLDEQKKRFLERIDDETKNWKFSSGDLDERALWPEYMKAYEDAINGTASKHSPWYVIPADQKWYARYLISQAIVEVLEDCKPCYPEMPEEERAKLAACKARLNDEGKGKKAAATSAAQTEAAPEAAQAETAETAARAVEATDSTVKTERSGESSDEMLEEATAPAETPAETPEA